MFQLPSAKRVRRDELQSPTSSPRSSPNPTLIELFRTNIHNEYTYTTPDHVDEAAAESGEDETELRLFAAPSSAPQTHTIRLSSPDAGNGEPGMAVKRPPSYYFADELDEKKEAMLQAVAIDGDTVKELAKLPWPGCALPWKVTKISPAGLQKAVLVGHPTEVVAVTEEASKRRRKGKKTRIALRKKIEAAKAKQEEREKLAKAKEESEQAKRTRRNREKKLKKKAKEKAKKLAGPAGGDAAQQELEDVSDSASE